VKGYFTPHWFPDSRSLFVLDTAESQWLFKRVDIETGEAKVVLSGTNNRPNAILSPDGNSLFFSRREKNESDYRFGLNRLMRKDLDSGEEKELFRAESPGVGTPWSRSSPAGSRSARCSAHWPPASSPTGSGARRR
jgi:hypothetical protein